MSLSILEEKINNNNIEEAIDIISEIGNNKDVEAVPFLIHHLVDTNNNILRNAIAIALADIGSNEAIEPLISMIKNPKTIGYRGTLLYALESFDCSDHAQLIVDLLGEDNFEVSRQSLLLLESIADNIPKEVKQKCIQKIQDKIVSLQDKIEFLSESLEVLM
ncbi:HEAT repeat domain-containing protein [Paenibacillus tarimensis]